MRWFGGSATAGLAVVPEGARSLWSGPAPVWAVGDWSRDELRVAEDRTRRVAVFGPCGARPSELDALLGGLSDSLAMAWPGTYAVVHVDAAGVTTILTDPAGACPIYVWSHGGGAVWGSSAWALSGLARGGLDAAWLAVHLLAPGSTAGLDRSAFVGVRLVPAGSRLTVRPGEQSRCERAWRPSRSRTVERGAGRLRGALDDAVGVRVRWACRPTVDCSGGMDSTSVCMLAAQFRRVTAVTVHPEGVHGGGDLDYARAAAGGHPRIDHVLLSLGRDELPYTALERVPVSDEPAPSTITFARLAAELDLLAADGSDCHLTGDGGDTLFCLPPQYLADLVRRGRMLRVIRDAQGWARLRQAGPWPILRRAIATAADANRTATGWKPYVEQPAPTAVEWAAPRAHELAAGALGTAGAAAPGLDLAGAVTLAEVRAVARSARADAQLAERFGVRLHNPLLDARVVDAVLAVAAWRRGSPWEYKRLLVAAVADVLPATVAGRRTKGSFDADHHRGLRANLDTVLDLADGHLASLALIDAARLRGIVRRAAAGLPVAFAGFEPALAAETWARTVSSTPPVAWIRRLSTAPIGAVRT